MISVKLEIVSNCVLPYVRNDEKSNQCVNDESGMHLATSKLPFKQYAGPETVYPELHVGWHVDPLARVLVQSPTPPFVGATEAPHVLDDSTRPRSSKITTKTSKMANFMLTCQIIQPRR